MKMHGVLPNTSSSRLVQAAHYDGMCSTWVKYRTHIGSVLKCVQTALHGWSDGPKRSNCLAMKAETEKHRVEHRMEHCLEHHSLLGTLRSLIYSRKNLLGHFANFDYTSEVQLASIWSILPPALVNKSREGVLCVWGTKRYFLSGKVYKKFLL